jgi:uracil-DNA glycosylase family 4
MFVKTEGPPTAEIMLVGEAPGREENAIGKPFIGYAGHTLNMLLEQAGIVRYNCLIANVAREQPPGNKINFYFEDYRCTVPKPILREWIALLKREIEQFRPNIIVALGRTALWALTGKTNISSARGYIVESTLVPGTKVLPTYHPQAINYEWKLHYPTVLDLRKALEHSSTPDIPKDVRRLNTSPSALEFIEYMQQLIKDKSVIAVDIESTAKSHIDIIGIADSPNHALSFSFLTHKKPRYSSGQEAEIWHYIGELFSKNKVIMHNAVYDMSVLWLQNGILCTDVEDTMIMAHVVWPELPRSLGFLTSICLDVPEWKYQASDLPTFYNAQDVANTFGIYNILKDTLEKQGIYDTYEFERSQIEVCSFLQLRGIDVDIKKKETFRDDVLSSLTDLQIEINALAGREVNIGSPAQLKELLYGTLDFEPQFKRRQSKTEARKLTTDEEALSKLMRKNPDSPILQKIVTAKKLAKVASSFTNFDVSPEGKVHTSYNITGSTTQRQEKGLIIDDEDHHRSFGRWSSSKSIILPYGSGNLQNIPKEVRKLYVAGEGKKLVQGDYIQAEAVVVAYCSGDSTLIDMFKKSFGASREERAKNNWDVHKMKAAQLYRIDVSQVTPEQRRIGKTLRHAVNYSAGPSVLMNKLGVSMKEAKDLLQFDRNANPHLEIWHRKIQEELRNTRTLTNLLGRRHRFLDRWPKPGEEHNSSLFRSAYSYIPQSTVGDLLNKSLVRLYNVYGESIDVVLQLHDAIYCAVPEDEVDRTIEKMRECMLAPLHLGNEEFTIDVDFSVGDTWGTMEEI